MKLKICGVKSVEEARQLREASVDLVGLNFIPTSKRFISIEAAQLIVNEFKDSDIKLGGLFAGHSIKDVNSYARQLKLDYVQLHGNEPADYAKAVESSVIRAIAVVPAQLPEDLLEFISQFPADYFVLDRQQQGQGELVNPDLANQVIAANPNKIFLAGGLTPDNLASVLSRSHPYGIDIAGGVRDQNDDLDISKVEQVIKLLG